jgi:NAD(P)-dependent dehydrogenase (short-subunit alcohol dehydrogenase family)
MNTAQHNIPSGFGARTTASEVLGGIDLDGKLAIVTGGYSGLGIEIVAALATAGAHVIVPARRVEVAREALTERGLLGTGTTGGTDGTGTTGGTRGIGGIGNTDGTDLGGVEVEELDLGDLASVRAFAERFLASGRSIDMLINDAAIMAAPLARVGDGWESQFAINHLGHFALANLLWPALVADGGARVVAMSSSGHKLSGIRWDDPQFTTGYDKWLAYGQAKTANSLFAVQLDKLGAPHGVRAFATHPGGIMTPLQRHLPREEMIASGWMTEDGTVSDRFKTPEQGAATATWAATSTMLDGMGGVYCEDCDIAEPTVADSPEARIAGVNAHAIDQVDAERLWSYSAELTGVDAFATK